MSLADRAARGPEAPVHGAPCSVGELLATLPDEEAEALFVMLANGWSGTAIYDALVAEGHTVGRQTINTHRRKQCRCFPRESS